MGEGRGGDVEKRWYQKKIKIKKLKKDQNDRSRSLIFIANQTGVVLTPRRRARAREHASFGHCVGGPILGRISFVGRCYISPSGGLTLSPFAPFRPLLPRPLSPPMCRRETQDAGNNCIILRKCGRARS